MADHPQPERKKKPPTDAIDPKTGKRIVFVDNVPEFYWDFHLRDERLTPEQAVEAEKLDKLPHLERAKQGKSAWNLWADYTKSRWLQIVEDEGEVHVSIAAWAVDDKSNWICFRNANNAIIRGKNSSDHADYIDFIFPGPVSFENIPFTSVATFRRAVFCAVTSFEKANFHHDVSFREAIFEGDAWFAGSKFSKAAMFYGGAFNGDAVFNGATFGGDTSFSHVPFKKQTRLQNVHFRGRLVLWGAAFYQEAYFDNNIYDGPSHFEAVASLGLIDFSDSVFERSATFQSSVFLSGANFGSVEFRSSVNFDDVCFGSVPDDLLHADGNNTNWSAPVKGAARQYTPAAGTKAVPNFLGSVFKQNPNLGYVKIPIPATIFDHFSPAKQEQQTLNLEAMHKSAAARYRRLREMAAMGHNHLAEAEMFRGEMLARRGCEIANPLQILVITLYDLFFKFGLSWWRPVAIWLVLMAGFSYIYHGLSKVPSWKEAVFLAFSNSLPVVGSTKALTSSSFELLFGKVDHIPVLVRFLALGQNIASTVLLFFVLLAVRNYFKMR